MKYKTCTKCGEEFEATTEFFYRRRMSKDGLRPNCKVCYSQQGSELYKNNREKILQRNYKWRKNNREKVKQQSSNYYHEQMKNPELHEKIKQKNREWQKNNPEKNAAKAAKRRAQKRNQTIDLTQDERDRIDLIYKKSHELGSGWHVDHIIPLSKNGLHHPDNLQIVTASYNLQKSDKLNFRLPFEWEIYKI